MQQLPGMPAMTATPETPPHQPQAEHEQEAEHRPSREVTIERPPPLEPVSDSAWWEGHSDELESLAGLEGWLRRQARNSW